MPRTKAIKKKSPAGHSIFLQTLENNQELLLNEYQEECGNALNQIRPQLQKAKLEIPRHILNMTIGELEHLPLDWSGSTTNSSTTQLLNATREMTVMKKKHIRSSSVGDDEGYLTAESSKSTSGRRSRTRSRALDKTHRISRSTSVRKATEKYKTPANKMPPPAYGTVTPKVKPNTPQIVLRRPNMGEVALSFQGSPLLTGAFTTDTYANINIPLDNGRMLSIQPQRGLRMSQIPDINLETKRQLETLRDHLNKVCALAGER